MTGRKRSIYDAKFDAECAHLKAIGMSYPEIAKQKGCAQSTAHTAVQRAIAAVPVEAVTELRHIQSAMLNTIIADLFKIAQNLNTDASTRIQAYREIRQSNESLRKLFGTDAPARQTITVITEDAIDAKIRELEGVLEDRVAEQARAEADAAADA